MPTRRTSPRRALTRPTAVDAAVDDDVAGVRSPGPLSTAAPWLGLLALAVAAAGLGVGFLNRGQDLSACRSAAWASIPGKTNLPEGWTLGSTDLNANGMTLAIYGPASTDGTTAQPVVYASVTCYGDVAATAMQRNRDAAQAAGSSVVDRTSASDAYDVHNPLTGSTTTLFRVGPLIGQVADAGSAGGDDLAAITGAVAAAMGDDRAAGQPGPAPSDAATGSEEPAATVEIGGSAEPEASSIAPSWRPSCQPRSVARS